MKDEIFAKIDTSKGLILIELFFDKTPVTVANFIGLAEGLIKNEVKKDGVPFYDNLKFHRVIPDFMIQGGCPKGSGTGDPGYKFDDEFHPDLKHSKPGVLSMANSGPGTNGSQFFITHTATPWLDGKHTIFGQVIEGQQIVDIIEQDDLINTVLIVRNGDKAKKFNALKLFNEFIDSFTLIQEESKKKEIEKLNRLTEGCEKTKNGLNYKITLKNDGLKPIKGQTVKVHYKGMLLDETVFDSSYDRNQPIEFKIGLGQVIPGWDQGIILLGIGEEATFIIPSELGYGSSGAGGVIPPNATLVFEVKLLAIS